MSIDSDIRYYRDKISKIQAALPNVKLAITIYNNAIEELKKIKGVARCKELNVKIQNKIGELKSLINTMDKEIESYNAKIAALQREKAAQERAARERAAKEKAAAGGGT